MLMAIHTDMKGQYHLTCTSRGEDSKLESQVLSEESSHNNQNMPKKKERKSLYH
uniref:Uncharacterized protein n=1 Tax=Rhizophora mucronata TaxID=61149 RepID=A0A2P2PK14_RHIMU